MTTKPPKWETKRNTASRLVEDALKAAGFDQADAYRYNSASIRVRVVDSRFEGVSEEKRDALVERELKKLPDAIQADIVNLLVFAPSDLEDPLNLLNREFDDPKPSRL